MKKFAIGLIVSFAVIAVSPNAIAQGGPGGPGGHGPHNGACKADMEKFCANEPGPDCIQKNLDKFSPKCRKKMGKHMGGMKKMHEACASDIKKLCPDSKGPEMMKCMKDNEANLSAKCKEHAKKGPPPPDQE